MSATPAVVDAALRQIEMGFAVFALERDGKRPITTHGFKDATRDAKRAETQLLGPKAGNYGMTWPADSPTVVFALDLDNGSDGRERAWQERLGELVVKYGPLPGTKHTRTPSGGRHAFYVWPSDIPVPPGDAMFGFTTRWPGRGYLVGPGSTIGDKAYEDGGVTSIAPFPRAWAEAAAVPERKTEALIVVTAGGYVLPDYIPGGQRYAAVRDYVASRYNTGLKLEEIWALVRSEVAPRFGQPKTEAELRADFERCTKDLAKRLGPPSIVVEKGAHKMTVEDRVKAARPMRIVRADDIQMEAVEWLWHAWLPIGSVTLFDGNPGQGKSTIVGDLVARITTGREWPDGTTMTSAGDVMYFTKEDDFATQVVPRAYVSGADMSRLYTVSDDLLFPRDWGRFREGVEAIRPRLILIDPIMSYLGSGVKSISDNDVREALMTPLQEIAREFHCAALSIRHFNKGTGQSALNRGAGSLGGFAGAARQVWGIITHPGDPDGPERVFGVVKINQEARPKSLLMELQGAPVPEMQFTVSTAVWKGPSDISVVTAMERDSEHHDKIQSAMEDLAEILDPRHALSGMESRTVKQKLKARGHSERTIKEAAREMHLISRRTSDVPSKTVWMMPTGIHVEAA
jgi:hypothetical protein